MHICYLYPFYPPERESFGIGTFVWEVSHALVKNPKIQVSIVSKTKNSMNSFESIDGINVYRISEQETGINRIIDNLTNHIFSTLFFSIRARKAILKISKTHKIDLLEACDFGGDAITLCNQTLQFPLIIRCHTPGFLLDIYNQNEARSSSVTTSLIEKIILQKAKNIVFPTRGLYDELVKYVKIEGDIVFQPYLIDVHRFTARHERTGSIKLRIVSIGRVEKRKGSKLLCQAFSQLITDGSNSELYFIGRDSITEAYNNSYIAYLQKDIIPKKVISHVHFLPEINREKLSNTICKFDVLVLPSLFEGVGYVALEAMASRLPVIGSNHGGTSELIINNQTGFLIDPLSVDELYNKLNLFIHNRSLLNIMGERGLARVKRVYETQVVIKDITNYYKKVIKNYKSI